MSQIWPAVTPPRFLVSFWQIPLFFLDLSFQNWFLGSCTYPASTLGIVQVPLSGGCCLETKIWVLGGLVTTGASLLLGPLSWQGILLAIGYSLDSTDTDISLIVKRKKMGLLDLGVQSGAPAPRTLSTFIQLVLSLLCRIQLAGENARRGCCWRNSFSLPLGPRIGRM